MTTPRELLAKYTTQSQMGSFFIDRLGVISVTSYGVVGDGVTDDTSAMQTALDAMKTNNSTLWIPSHLTVLVDALTITSASNFALIVDGTLKRINDGATSAMLTFTTCSNFNIVRLNADGNVANNGVTINEHQHVITMAGCTDVYIGKIKAVNVAGDILYITTNCQRIQCDDLYGYSNDTGRNTLSIISGENMQFNNITSIGVGTESMPGGVDLEPNVSSDDIKNIQFGNIYCYGLGTALLGLGNNVSATCENIAVSNAVLVKKTRIAGSSIKTCLSITNFNHVNIKAIMTEDQSTPANLTTTGLLVIGGEDIDLDLEIYNVQTGARVGMTTQTNRINMRGKIHHVRGGMEVGLVNNGDFSVEFFECNITGSTDRQLYWTGGTTTNTIFHNCKFVKETYGYAGVYPAGTLTNVKFINCEFRGWPDLDYAFSHVTGTFTNVQRISCPGLNYGTAIPTEATRFFAGEEIENTTPAITGSGGSQYVVNGWRRITNGFAHVLNTDWVETRTLTGT